MVLVLGVSGGPQPVDGNGESGHNHSGGDAAADVGMEGEERGPDAHSEEWRIEVGVEGSVEVSGNGGVDVFIEINLVLIDLANFLLPLEQLQGEEFGVIILGVRQGLKIDKSHTKNPLCIL